MRKREATSPPRSGYPVSRLSRHEGGAHMPDDRCRLGSEDVVIGLDLASAEHQAVVLTAAGQRLARFREARQLSREKTDLTDAEQIAELCRTGWSRAPNWRLAPPWRCGAPRASM